MDDIDREVQLAHDRLLKTLEQANAAGVISDEALRRAVSVGRQHLSDRMS